MADATCRTCSFYALLQPDANRGFCRRRAPTLGENGRAVYPPAYDTGWCGDHPDRQRDLLAAVAMQGALAYYGYENDIEADDIARSAYNQADAMLAQRANGSDRG